MNTGHQRQRSLLFTVRLWAEDLDGSRREWRGQVQHVTSGETHYFREWPTLIAWLLAIVPSSESYQGADEQG